MKKYLSLLSILTLSACGGSGSTHTTTIDNLDIPNQRVSTDAALSNDYVTGMHSSITNLGAMTNAVETAIGTDALNTIANDYNNIYASMHRAAMPRHSGLNGNHSTKEKSAYIFLEGGKMFLEWSNDKRRKFFTEQPNLVKYWGSLFCGCNLDGHTNDEILSIFDNDASIFNDFYNQHHYREYTLQDVEFTMAAASAGSGDEGGSKDILTFKLDKNGQIDAVNHIAYISQDGDLIQETSATATFKRNNKSSNTFNVGQINGEGKFYTGNGVIITYGKDIGSGLKYSDFGQLKYDLIATYPNGYQETEKSFEPFAGGYKDLRKETPGASMNFSGQAHGSVSNNNTDKNIAGNATLAFNDGTETLNMDFSNTTLTTDDTPWYNVTIVRNKTLNTQSITFETNDTLNDTIPDNLQFNDFVGNTRTPTYNLVDGYNGEGFGNQKMPGKGDGKLDIGYYGGPDGNVTEATGVTQYVESLGGIDNEIRMNVGFGMMKN